MNFGKQLQKRSAPQHRPVAYGSAGGRVGILRCACLMIFISSSALWAIATGVELTGTAAGPEAPLCLWYRQPAKLWEEALPLGNGHIGAMVFGGVPTERIQFNEHTVWTGKPHSYANADAVKALPEMRRLLFEARTLELQGLEKQKQESPALQAEARQLIAAARAKQKKAEDLGMKEFMSEPLGQKAYQPCGDLWIDFNGQNQVADYRRWLDLDSAVATTEYKSGAVTFRREVFVSNPDRALCVRLTASQPGKLDCVVRLSRHRHCKVSALVRIYEDD